MSLSISCTRMGTSRQEDRSLSSGISLSQWMKEKMDKFDFDDTAFLSPPTYDDNFFHIRYQRSQNSEVSQQESKSGTVQVSNEKNISSLTNQITSQKSITDSKAAKQIDFSKHTLPCQPFISSVNIGDIRTQPTVTIGKNIKVAKSQGTDDGFYGEPALCGKSIVHVANQMMSGKFTKLFASDSHSQQGIESPSKHVSKSLPTTPLTSPAGTPDSSPKTRRKIHGNRYFSGAFVPDKEKYQGSWILAGILGQSRDVVTTKIEEEDEPFADVEPNKPLNRKKSISSQNLTYIGKEEKSADKSLVYANVPTELREMNCWSPTSM